MKHVKVFSTTITNALPFVFQTTKRIAIFGIQFNVTRSNTGTIYQNPIVYQATDEGFLEYLRKVRDGYQYFRIYRKSDRETMFKYLNAYLKSDIYWARLDYHAILDGANKRRLRRILERKEATT